MRKFMHNSFSLPKKSFLMIVLLIIIFYAVHFYIYNFPSADDYSYASIPNDISNLSFAFSEYFSWSGRLFSNFLYSAFMRLGTDFSGYRIITFLSLMFFFVSIWLLVNLLTRFTTIFNRIIISLLFIAAWLFGLNSPSNAIFWMGGVTNYLIPIAIQIFALLLILTGMGLHNNLYKYILFAFSFILSFISAFSNEIIPVSFIVLYFFLAAAFTYNKEKIKYIFYSQILVLITATLIMAVAPGNDSRLAAEGTAHGAILASIWKSLMTSLERGAEAYFASMVIPASIFIYFLIADKPLPLPIKNMSLRQHALLFVIASIASAWAAHFTIAYALNYTGLPPPEPKWCHKPII